MRVTSTPVRRARRKKWLKLAKGYWGHRSIGYRTARQAVIRSWVYSFNDRKDLKGEFRKLWIARINAATRAQGVSYSKFMYGLKQHNVLLNRKMLSEMAIHDQKLFDSLVKLSQQTPTNPPAKVVKAPKKFRPKMYAQSKAHQTSSRQKNKKAKAKIQVAKSIMRHKQAKLAAKNK